MTLIRMVPLEVQETLLLEDSLSWDKAIKIAQACEISRAHMKEIHKESEKEVHVIRGDKERKPKLSKEYLSCNGGNMLQIPQ